ARSPRPARRMAIDRVHERLSRAIRCLRKTERPHRAGGGRSLRDCEIASPRQDGEDSVPRTTAEVEFPQAATASFFFRRQAVHLLYLAALLPIARGLAAPALGHGTWLGRSDTWWFAICLGVAVIHQVYIWIAWRAQLGWKVFTRVFGAGDFAIYNAVFFPLLILRPALVAATSVADTGSLRLPTGLALGLGALLSVP